MQKIGSTQSLSTCLRLYWMTSIQTEEEEKEFFLNNGFYEIEESSLFYADSINSYYMTNLKNLSRGSLGYSIKNTFILRFGAVTTKKLITK